MLCTIPVPVMICSVFSFINLLLVLLRDSLLPIIVLFLLLQQYPL